MIYCLVERDAVSEVNGVVFDLISHGYHLLIASGSTFNYELSIGYHDINRGASSHSILFTEDNPILIRLWNDKVSKTLILLHGSFMIVAWIGATTIGVFSARYMKTLWVGKQVFGKDIWFVVHQVAMSLTWILTIAAVIIIWIDVGEWRTSTHSLLGIIATALCFIQPLTAFFRPAPNDEARPIFNFMHGSVGKLAHIIAGKILAALKLVNYFSNLSSTHSHHNLLCNFLGASGSSSMDEIHSHSLYCCLSYLLCGSHGECSNFCDLRFACDKSLSFSLTMCLPIRSVDFFYYHCRIWVSSVILNNDNWMNH